MDLVASWSPLAAAHQSQLYLCPLNFTFSEVLKVETSHGRSIYIMKLTNTPKQVCPWCCFSQRICY